MNLKNGNDSIVVGLLIIIALCLWFVFSFGFEIRREEAAAALTALTNTVIGG